MNKVIVKRSSKIFENSFLKNGILEFLSAAQKIMKKFVIYVLEQNSDDEKIFAKILESRQYLIIQVA